MFVYKVTSLHSLKYAVLEGFTHCVNLKNFSGSTSIIYPHQISKYQLSLKVHLLQRKKKEERFFPPCFLTDPAPEIWNNLRFMGLSVQNMAPENAFKLN